MWKKPMRTRGASGGDRLSAALAALVLGLLAGGCGQGSGLRDPDVALVNLGRVAFQGVGGTTRLKLRVFNPNPEAFLLEGVQVKLAANGENFCKGMTAVNQEVAPFGNLEVAVPATLANLALLRAGTKSISSGKIDYTMFCTLTFKDKAGSRNVRRLRKSGKLGRLF